MACTLPSLNKYYVSAPSRAFDVGNTMAEIIDSLLGMIASIAHIVSSALHSQGKEVPAGATDVENKANTGRTMIGCVRAFQALESLFTLKWLCTSTPDSTTHTVGYRHPLAIATALSAIAARVLGFVSSLHNMLVVNLGKHAQHVSSATIALWTAVSTLGFIDAIHSYVNAKPAELREATINLVQSTAFLVTNPFECGMGMVGSVAPALGIVGGVISLVGAAVIIVTNVLQFGGFEEATD